MPVAKSTTAQVEAIAEHKGAQKDLNIENKHSKTLCDTSQTREVDCAYNTKGIDSDLTREESDDKNQN